MPCTKPKYTIDTCSLTAMRSVYPPDVFPGAWTKLDNLADAGVLVSIEDVLEELKHQEDDVCDWARKHPSIFHALDGPVQQKVREILRTHGNLVDIKRRKSGADPFVIAHAILNKCIVVTEEKPSGGPDKSKIPDVCKAYNVECIRVLDMFRREGLRL
jgi:hypothetical protein